MSSSSSSSSSSSFFVRSPSGSGEEFFPLRNKFTEQIMLAIFLMTQLIFI